MNLKGLYTAIITPFDQKGKLDTEGLRQNIQFQLANHVQGIVVLGTTGESPTLSHEEKETIVRIAREEIKGKAQFIIGTGSYSTDQTISATCKAQEMGADAALIITPYYNKPTQEGLYRHFAAICSASSLPVIIYNNPVRTGVNVRFDTLLRLAALPTITGIKDCSGSLSFLNDILQEIPAINPRFSVLTGDDEFVFPLMALGGHGAISSVGNLIPGPMNSLIQAAFSGDICSARHWHNQLRPLFKTLFIETNPIPIKAAMDIVGMASGPCRLPLCELAPDHYSQLAQSLKNIPSSWIGKE